jgi:hypothetical protein
MGRKSTTASGADYRRGRPNCACGIRGRNKGASLKGAFASAGITTKTGGLRTPDAVCIPNIAENAQLRSFSTVSAQSGSSEVRYSNGSITTRPFRGELPGWVNSSSPYHWNCVFLRRHRPLLASLAAFADPANVASRRVLKRWFSALQTRTGLERALYSQLCCMRDEVFR